MLTVSVAFNNRPTRPPWKVTHQSRQSAMATFVTVIPTPKIRERMVVQEISCNRQERHDEEHRRRQHTGDQSVRSSFSAVRSAVALRAVARGLPTEAHWRGEVRRRAMAVGWPTEAHWRDEARLRAARYGGQPSRDRERRLVDAGRIELPASALRTQRSPS